MKTRHNLTCVPAHLRPAATVFACLFAMQAMAQTAAEPPATEVGVAELPAIQVTARDIGQRAERASSVTKGSTPLVKTPMSVQVVSEALIDDRQASGLREALETVSGVFAGSTSLHEDILVRGMPVYVSYRNGVRTRRFGPTELANAARIEVLKGPSSTQFGRGDVSGVFNVVTRRPEKDPYYALEQQIGSHDLYQTRFDATGPLNEDKSLQYRLDASVEKAGSFRDFIRTEHNFVAPALRWQPNATSWFDLQLEYMRHDSPIDRGIVARGDRPADVPRERNFGEAFSRHVNESTLLALEGEQGLEAGWKLRENVMAERGRGRGFEYQHMLVSRLDPTLADDLGVPPGLRDRTLLRQPRRLEQRAVDTRFASLELAGDPRWGGMVHDVVIGVDHARYTGRFDFRVGSFDTVDLFDPVYAGVEPETPDTDLQVNNRSRAWGVYAQDQIRLNEKLNLLLGGRFDRATESSTNRLDGSSRESIDKKFSPRVGLVYSPVSWGSIYTSYTEAFSEANLDRNAANEPFKPVIGKQAELGFKAESANKSLFTTIALYHLKKQNLVLPDPADPSQSIQVGEARSRGFEWDFGGRITSRLNVTASYSYTDAIVSRDPVKQGKRLYGVPRHSARAFVRYDQQAGGQAGWSLGAGAAALGAREGDVDNTFRIPGYGRVDLMASYRWRAAGTRWTVQLNLENVSDKTYYLPSGSPEEIAVGKPRTLLASLRAEL